MLAVVGAIVYTLVTYWSTFQRDPEMLGIVAFCAVIGVLAAWGKFGRWKRRIGAARDLTQGNW